MDQGSADRGHHGPQREPRGQDERSRAARLGDARHRQDHQRSRGVRDPSRLRSPSSPTRTCTGGTAVTNTGPGHRRRRHPSMRSAASVRVRCRPLLLQGVRRRQRQLPGDNSGCEPFDGEQGSLTVDSEVHNARARRQDQRLTCRSARSCTTPRRSPVRSVGSSTEPVTFTVLRQRHLHRRHRGDQHGCGQGRRHRVGRPPPPRWVQASYSYKGTVAGNDNYNGDNSGCEPFDGEPGSADRGHRGPQREPRRQDERLPCRSAR